MKNIGKACFREGKLPKTGSIRRTVSIAIDTLVAALSVFMLCLLLYCMLCK